MPYDSLDDLAEGSKTPCQSMPRKYLKKLTTTHGMNIKIQKIETGNG
jgi:hypothetical protein